MIYLSYTESEVDYLLIFFRVFVGGVATPGALVPDIVGDLALDPGLEPLLHPLEPVHGSDPLKSGCDAALLQRPDLRSGGFRRKPGGRV